MTKLVCPDCRHENEPERIYCHNCGARLERSQVRKEIAAAEPTPEESQQHLRKMFRPSRREQLAPVFTFLKILGGAFCFAFLIQMLLPPDLPELKTGDSFAPMISMDLLSASQSHNPPQLTYSQDQVNDYLASAIRRSKSPAKEGYFPIQRIFAQFSEGVCRIDVAYSFFGLPLYVGSAYRVSVGQDKIQADVISGSIGRMPILPSLMQNFGLLFHKTWETLKREREQVARLAGIEFHPQSVTLVIVR